MKGAALSFVGAALPFESLADQATPVKPTTAAEGGITDALIAGAEPLVGVAFPAASRAAIAETVKELRTGLDALRATALENAALPVLTFRPEGRQPSEGRKIQVRPQTVSIGRPVSDDELSFLSVVELGALLKTRRISSVELTRLFLARLDTYGRRLNAVITLTPERALRTAARADGLFAKGIVRSPLQGIPTGVKDLFATTDAPTTWGAAPFKDQQLDYDAAVIQRLEVAGAPMLGKLSLGALAWDDVWFGGKTRNPWNPAQGSGGSSAGSAATVAAGLLPFAIGTEALGSIVTPSERCRIVGLRPTFGRISRFGMMSGTWSIDKVGILARSAEDTALVLGALAGADPRDPSSVDRPFTYTHTNRLKGVKIAVVGENATGENTTGAEGAGTTLSKAAAHLLDLGATLSSATFTPAPEAIVTILYVEGAAAFDDFTRSARIDDLKSSPWPVALRAAMYVTGVDYVQALRYRRLAALQFEREFSDADLILAPGIADDLVLTTNATGHPQVYVPLGLDPQNNPVGVSLIGRLYDEGQMLAAAQALQTRFAVPKSRPNFSRLSLLDD